MEAELATARLPARDDQIAAAEAEVAMREASLAQARWDFDQRTVRAPMAALVDDRVRDSRGVGRRRRHRRQPAAARQGQGPLLRARAGAGPGPCRASRSTCAATAVPHGMTGTVRFIAPEAEYTPPVIYSVGSRGKLVFMVEAWPADGISLNPGQPSTCALR